MRVRENLPERDKNCLPKALLVPHNNCVKIIQPNDGYLAYISTIYIHQELNQ